MILRYKSNLNQDDYAAEYTKWLMLHNYTMVSCTRLLGMENTNRHMHTHTDTCIHTQTHAYNVNTHRHMHTTKCGIC